MPTRAVTLIGGSAHSKTTPVVVTNIPLGNALAGTFTGRSAYYSVDFVLGIYTDKDKRLQLTIIASDTANPLSAKRVDNQTWTLAAGSGASLGTFNYDSATGDFSITGDSDQRWLQGELQGTYVPIV